MTINEMISAVEACLFASGDPVPLNKLAQALESDTKTVTGVLNMLADRLSDNGSAIELVRLDDSYQLCTKKQYSQYVKNLLEIKRNTPLSQSALETLAIVAYNQPVTKSLVDQIRGVDSYYTVSTLCEKGLIEEADRLNIPGRPITYVTTSHFLRCFSMNSLEDLVPTSEIVSGFESENELLLPNEEEQPEE